MYTPEFRDNVYKQQNGRPPWITSEHIENAVNWFDQHLLGDMKGKHVLDYGCGNGDIGESFLQKGADVDFAEISNKMVNLLREKYGYSRELSKTLDDENIAGKAKIFWVKSPQDLPVEKESYDYIIIWSVFHHINPDNWKEFLDRFSELLKSGGKIIITGWDESDAVLKQDGFKGYVTGQPSYSINGLLNYLDGEKCEVEETGVYDEKLPAFDVPRMFRYYIVKRK